MARFREARGKGEKLAIGVGDRKMIGVSKRETRSVRQLVSIILARRLGWGRLSALASIYDGEQNAGEKRKALARTTRRKRSVEEERERIAARATRREKPYADSSRGRTRERNRKRQRPVRQPFWHIHRACQPEMRKNYHTRVCCGPYIEFAITTIKTFPNAFYIRGRTVLSATIASKTILEACRNTKKRAFTSLLDMNVSTTLPPLLSHRFSISIVIKST